MKVSYIVEIVLCCYLLCCPSLACDKDLKFPVDNQVSELKGNIPNVFLCRMCGLSLNDGGSFVDVTSPYSLSTWNETVLVENNKETIATTVSVQKLRNPAGVVFDVVTLKKSSCKGVGKVNSFRFNLSNLSSHRSFDLRLLTILSLYFPVGFWFFLVPRVQLESVLVYSVWASPWLVSSVCKFHWFPKFLFDYLWQDVWSGFDYQRTFTKQTVRIRILRFDPGPYLDGIQ